MWKELDSIDKGILDRVNTNQCRSISDVIRPFLSERSETVLRIRVRALELRELIKTTRTKREILCVGVVGLKMESDHLDQLGQFDQAYQDQAAAEVLIEAEESARREEYEAAARTRKGL
jgi:hypothetical protein